MLVVIQMFVATSKSLPFYELLIICYRGKMDRSY